MVPETGETLPKDAICFLDIPVNKTMTAYTKPVHPLVGQRINEWEKVRPSEQPRQVDGKTSESGPCLPGLGQRTVTSFCFVKKRMESSPRICTSAKAEFRVPPKLR